MVITVEPGCYFNPALLLPALEVRASSSCTWPFCLFFFTCALARAVVHPVAPPWLTARRGTPRYLPACLPVCPLPSTAHTTLAWSVSSCNLPLHMHVCTRKRAPFTRGHIPFLARPGPLPRSPTRGALSSLSSSAPLPGPRQVAVPGAGRCAGAHVAGGRAPGGQRGGHGGRRGEPHRRAAQRG